MPPTPAAKISALASSSSPIPSCRIPQRSCRKPPRKARTSITPNGLIENEPMWKSSWIIGSWGSRRRAVGGAMVARCRIAPPMITDETRDCYARLAERVRQSASGGAASKTGRWLVLTHDNPDPDALASALILTRVLRSAFRQKATTAYGGIIGRAENREMVKSLRLRLSHVRNLNLKRYQRFALADTQPKSGNNQLPPRAVPDIVIDHHPLRQATRLGPFHDVRPKYGATATILAEYLLASGVRSTHAIATALIYALRTETNDFAREFTGPDTAIYDRFFPQADHRLPARIQTRRLPLAYFSNLHDALAAL